MYKVGLFLNHMTELIHRMLHFSLKTFFSSFVEKNQLSRPSFPKV